MKRFQFLCEQLKLDLKKQFLFLILGISIIILFGIIIFIFYDKILGGLFSLLSFCYIFIFIGVLEENYERLVREKEFAFLSFYRFLISFYYQNHNLYQTLKMAFHYCEEVIKFDVEEFIRNIELDASLTPFLSFAKQFKNEQIKQLILWLYSIQSLEDEEIFLKNIQPFISNLQDQSMNQLLKQEERKFDKFNFLPVAFTLIIILIFSVYVLYQIGGNLYG